MKKQLILMLLALTLSSNDVCYQIDKKHIKTNLQPPEGLLINIGTMFTNPKRDDYNITRGYVSIAFDTPRYTPYLSVVNLDCTEEEGGLFQCSGDCDGGHIYVMKKKDNVYFKIEGVRMAETPDDPIIYDIEGRSDRFVKGQESSCYQSTMDAVIDVKNFEEDIQKEKLITSLKKRKDIIIYDIDYNNQVAIAVGEDNSLRTRKEKSKDEYYLGATLFSFDGGKHWVKSLAGDIPLSRVIVLEGKKAISIGSMEGAGGFVQMTSDGGKHWKTVYEGGFINDITQHANGFFAVGYGIIYSKEGKKWNTVLKAKETAFNTVLSVDENRLVTANNHQLFFSKDSGESWQKAKVPLDLESAWLRHLYKYKGKLYIWARHPEGFKMISIDKGKSWQDVN